jgi:hypothetical protein
MYGYVAENDPNMARAICHKYGYRIQGVQTKADLGVVLEQLVAKEGESALRDIVKNHPDRDLIVEIETAGSENIPIRQLPSESERSVTYADFMNYIGEEKGNRSNSVSQTNTFLLASAFLLGVAIITSKK